MIGLEADRFDVRGVGPDLLWLLPNGVALVIEAKSRKKKQNALTKEEHGQLLAASEWCQATYCGPDHSIVRVVSMQQPRDRPSQR